jgi:hypothetical protein
LRSANLGEAVEEEGVLLRRLKGIQAFLLKGVVEGHDGPQELRSVHVAERACERSGRGNAR